MVTCIDENSPEQRNIRLLSTTSNIVSPNGSFNFNVIDVMESEFSQSIATSIDATPVSRAITIFGIEPFYNSLGITNTFLQRDLTEYENLTARFKDVAVITPAEYAEFILEYLYTPESIETNISGNSGKVLDQLEEYYEKNFTQSTIGAFCSIIPGIFSAIDSFFDAIDNIKSAIDTIQNFSLAALMNTLKKQLTAVIDKVISKVKKIIENFSITNIIGKIETFVNTKIIEKALKLKEQALSFFTKENIDKLKAKITGSIEYATNLFKNPSLEDIQFLIMRFCQFTSLVENAINEVQNPLTEFANTYDTTYRILSTASNQNTARVIRAGALRYDTDTRRNNINTSNDNFVSAGNMRDIDPQDVEDITPWNEGRGDSRIGFGGGLQPPAGNRSMGIEGWIGVKSEVRVMLMRVQKKFGRRLIVNSGYRSPEYNRRIGGALNSYHSQRVALDIAPAGGFTASSKAEFIRIAREEGFRGIGTYNTFVHVDIGPERRWNG